MASSNNEFETLASQLDDLVICLSKEFTIEAINPAALTYFQWHDFRPKNERFIALCDQHGIDFSFLSSLNPAAREPHHCTLTIHGTRTDWQTLAITKDKQTAWLLIGTASAETDNQIPLDIIINKLPNHIYWTDAKGAYIGVNQQQLNTLGINRSQFIGHTPDKIASKLGWPKKLCEVLRKDDLQILRKNKSTSVEDGDGEKHYLSQKIPLQNSSGECIGLLGVSTDITDLKKLETALMRTQEQLTQQTQQTQYCLATIIQQLPGSLYWTTAQGTYLGCNNQQAKEFGVSNSHDIIGKDFLALGKQLGWGSKATKAIWQKNKAVIDSRQPLEEEETIKDANGNTQIRFVRRAPILNSTGMCVGLAVIALDITRRKQVEKDLRQAKHKAELSNHIKSEFISNMSHDIRTPLSNIIGLADITLKHTHEAHTQTYARDLAEAAQQLLHLLNEILSLSELDHTASDFKKIPFQPHHLAKKIETLLLPSIQNKGLSLSVDYDKCLPDTLLGHPTLLHRVLLNLLNNAIKFTESGYVRLCFKQITDKKLSQLRCTIEDSGIGIPANQLDNIFKAFTRLPDHQTHQHRGTGLGLYITKQFVDSMGGTLSVTSTIGQGSCFTCTIPLEATAPLPVDTTDTNALSAKMLASISQQQQRQGRILLIEDDPIAQKIATIKLIGHHALIDIATTGQEALRLCALHTYDLIYLDIGLPDCKGYEIAENIRHNTQQATPSTVPIIALTAHADDRTTSHCLAAGVDKVLHKPLSQETLDTAYQLLARAYHPQEALTP